MISLGISILVWSLAVFLFGVGRTKTKQKLSDDYLLSIMFICFSFAFAVFLIIYGITRW